MKLQDIIGHSQKKILDGFLESDNRLDWIDVKSIEWFFNNVLSHVSPLRKGTILKLATRRIHFLCARYVCR
jgi:hypothetical protein